MRTVADLSGRDASGDSQAEHALTVAKTYCTKLLVKMLEAHSSMRFACLGTLDGHLLASAGAPEDGSTQQLCAFTSSYFALGDAFANKTMGSSGSYGLIALRDGVIVIVKVATARATYCLSCGADGSQVLATTLRQALDLSSKCCAVLEEMML